MKPWMIILAIAVLIVIWFVTTYNSLVGMKQKVNEAFSGMDVYLKKRFDMIPNLVETVKGYADHESETLENVIKARNTYLTATTPEQAIDSDNQITQALGKLFSLTESYPDLKANDNFMQLQGDIRQCEVDISNARKFYNAVVRQYNGKVMMVPSNIVAGMFNFKEAPMYEASEGERQNVQVKF